jgi:hypothetical protein
VNGMAWDVLHLHKSYFCWGNVDSYSVVVGYEYVEVFEWEVVEGGMVDASYYLPSEKFKTGEPANDP